MPVLDLLEGGVEIAMELFGDARAKISETLSTDSEYVH